MSYLNSYLFPAFLFILLLNITSCGISGNKISDNPVGNEAVYSAELAQKMGADDYGMKKYVMAFLKRGPNRSQDEETRNKLQRAHLDNIGRLADEGKLLLAGPFLDNGDLRGIYIFNVESIEEARELTKSDPAIRQGSLIMELHPWYGSAALLMLNDLHKKLAKIDI